MNILNLNIDRDNEKIYRIIDEMQVTCEEYTKKNQIYRKKQFTKRHKMNKDKK